MASVELKGVSKRFSKTALAVDGIDLGVKDREFLVLVGPSGCGKSTTLRLIAGLEQCDEGIIRIGDREVNRVAPKDRDIAMVFQNYALYPHMTVYKNLSFGLQLRLGGGLLSRVVSRLLQPRKAAELAAKRREIHDRVTTTAERLGIDSLLKRKPHQLSGGERQRVALGRAIVREPAAFLFDEPLSNLDAKLRGQLRTEIKRLHQQLDTTMIYVTHDQIEAMTLGDRIAVMNEGRIQQLAAPMEVYHHPANLFVARFIGSLPMNLIDGQIVKQDSKILLTNKTFELELEESKELNSIVQQVRQRETADDASITLGIRPENIRIRSEGESTGDPSGKTTENRAADKSIVRAVVKSVDRLGDSTVAYLAPLENPSMERVKTAKADERKGQAGNQTEKDKEAIKQEFANKQEFLVRTDAFSSIQIGQTVETEWDMASAHWFDSKSGNNLKTK